ncbi:MAG: SDR family NAD(P)-dependent oxidoreductase [Alphaproteobacteria bacterium]|nr:SDR family NAD(P)-dependent oxidoreductase [Alphaproteobacteria bacterium]
MAAIAVTGANRGIGAGIAVALAERGFAVACLTRSGCGPEGLDLPAWPVDVTDAAGLARALDAAAEALGGLEGLVNNAGIHLQGTSAAFPVEDFARTMAVNTTAVFAAAQAVYPHLKANGGGIVVNLGSYWERLGVRDNAAYCASKAAVSGLTRCLAVEWARDNISVYTVAPGYVETDMNAGILANPRFRAWLKRRIPVGRPGRVDEVALFVALLFAEKIHYLTGETIVMDGAQSVNQ